MRVETPQWGKSVPISCVKQNTWVFNCVFSPELYLHHGLISCKSIHYNNCLFFCNQNSCSLWKKRGPTRAKYADKNLGKKCMQKFILHKNHNKYNYGFRIFEEISDARIQKIRLTWWIKLSTKLRILINSSYVHIFFWKILQKYSYILVI